MQLLAFIAALLLMCTSAFAADLPRAQALPLKAPLAPAPTCSITACSGFFIGGNVANTAGSFDIIGTGLNGIAQNGLGIGSQAGFELFNGVFYAAILADIDTDFYMNAQLGAPGTGVNFKDRLTYGVTARLGYNLAQQFGLSGPGAANLPPIPAFLSQTLMTPYVPVGIEWRHGQQALRSGLGAEFLVPSTNWTLNLDWYHYTYQSGANAGTIVGLPVSQANDNEFRFGFNYHPRFGS